MASQHLAVVERELLKEMQRKRKIRVVLLSLRISRERANLQLNSQTLLKT